MTIKIKGSSEVSCQVLSNGIFLIDDGESKIRLTPSQAKHLSKFISEEMETADARYHEYERGK